MNLLLTFLSLLIIPFCSFAQAPEKGDYLYVSFYGQDNGHYVFLKSGNVYYNFNPTTKEAENKYKQSSKMVKRIFSMADKVNLINLKGLDTSSLQNTNSGRYRVIEYRKGNVVKRYVWDTTQVEGDFEKMAEVDGQMNDLW